MQEKLLSKLYVDRWSYVNRAERLNTNYSCVYLVGQGYEKLEQSLIAFTVLLAMSITTSHSTTFNRPVKRNVTVKKKFIAERAHQRGYIRVLSVQQLAYSLVNRLGYIWSHTYLSCTCKSHAISSSISSGWNYFKITRMHIAFCALFLVIHRSIILPIIFMHDNSWQLFDLTRL